MVTSGIQSIVRAGDYFTYPGHEKKNAGSLVADVAAAAAAFL